MDNGILDSGRWTVVSGTFVDWRPSIKSPLVAKIVDGSRIYLKTTYARTTHEPPLSIAV